jgi:hypothetical protein
MARTHAHGAEVVEAKWRWVRGWVTLSALEYFSLIRFSPRGPRWSLLATAGPGSFLRRSCAGKAEWGRTTASQPLIVCVREIGMQVSGSEVTTAMR